MFKQTVEFSKFIILKRTYDYGIKRYDIWMSERSKNNHLLRDNKKTRLWVWGWVGKLLSNRDSEQTLGFTLMTFCTHVIRCYVSVEFINEHNHFDSF